MYFFINRITNSGYEIKNVKFMQYTIREKSDGIQENFTHLINNNT